MDGLSDKVQSFGECITRRMSLRAGENDALNLAQGFPNEDPPAEMLAAALASIKGHRNHYADMRGDPNLREAIALYTNRFNGLQVSGEQNITVTCGTTEALIATLLAVVNAGDEIILFEPWYENYLPQTILAGATLRLFTLEPPDYRIDLDKLKKMISSHTKAVILNTPNNPTGRVFSIEEMTGIADLCRTHNLYAIVDEIYQHIVYEGHEHISLASIDDMACRTITINGISKAFAATGWRVGWAIAPETVTLAIRRVHDFLTGTVPTPFQDAAIAGLNLPDSYFRMIVERYDKRRKRLADLLTEAGIKFFNPEGTYYLFADISNFGFDSSEAFTESLLKEARVAVVPGTAFFRTREWRDKMVRLTFSKDDETVACAGERIVEWARKRYESMH